MSLIDQPAEGPAFSIAAKTIATALLAALAWSGVSAAPQLVAHRGSVVQWLLLSLALAAITIVYFWILRSRTAIDSTHIRQTWLWPKEVAIAEVTEAKFVYVPYFAWLIAPRLVVRAGSKGRFVFHAADRRVLEAFARLSLGAHR